MGGARVIAFPSGRRRGASAGVATPVGAGERRRAARGGRGGAVHELDAHRDERAAARSEDHRAGASEPDPTTPAQASTAGGPAPAPREPVPVPFDRRAEAATYRLHVALMGSDPEIWRTLDVAHDLTLGPVFEATRTAMGWSGFLLHFFRVEGRVRDAVRGPAERTELTYSPAYGTWQRAGLDESGVRLDEVLGRVGDRIRLAVVDDFGDEWWHELRLDAVLPADPTRRARCVAGARACPPGDSEGIEDYNEVVAVWRHGWPGRRSATAAPPGVGWPRSHDPDAFDLAGVDEVLRHVVSVPQTPVPMRADVCDRLRDLWWRCTDDGRAALDVLAHDAGAQRTPGEADVPGDVADRLADWIDVVRAVNDGFAPATSDPDRELARAVEARRGGRPHPPGGGPERLVALAFAAGLLRRHRGRIVTTVAGRHGLTRPDLLWRHLATRPLRPATLAGDAALVGALHVAAGRSRSALLPHRILTSAGHTDAEDPLSVETTERVLSSLRAPLAYCGGVSGPEPGAPLTDSGRRLCRLVVGAPPTR